MIETRKREHSRKPDEQYPLIEACSPGPFLEMFARYPAPGWTVWGDEADAEVEPRGRVHQGYAGGPIQVPLIPAHGRIEDDVATYIGQELRRHDEAGKSIRDISLETSYSIGRVRTLLERADTPLRAAAPGSARPTPTRSSNRRCTTPSRASRRLPRH